MTTRHEGTLLPLGAAIGALVVAQPALAQTAADLSLAGQDIIVTASKRAERLIDVPASVTSLDG